MKAAKIKNIFWPLWLSACTSTGQQTIVDEPVKPLSILVGSGDQDIFDPDQSAQATFTLKNSFYCYAVRRDRNLNIVPDAVQSWTWSKDQKTITLQLAEGLSFHDGQPITAADLEFALIRPFLTTKGKTTRDDNIVGAENAKTGSIFRSGMIEGIKLDGRTRLTVTFKKADPDFLDRLTSYDKPLIPRQSLLADYANFKDIPVSCGDYKVTHITPGKEKISLQRFKPKPNAPALAELWNYDFKDLPSHPDLMMGGLFPKDKMDEKHYRLVYASEPNNLLTFHLNDRSPLVRLPAFRRAVDLAMPRAAIAATRQGEEATRDLAAVKSSAYLNRPVIQDLAEARKLWLTIPADLRDKEYRIYVKTNYPGPYFKVIEQALKNVGMKITMVPKQMKSFDNTNEQDVMLGLGLVLLKDGNLAMYQRYDDRNHQSDPFPAFAQNDLQRLIDAYKTALEPGARVEKAQEVARYVLEGNFVIPVSYGRAYYAMSSRIKGYAGDWDSGITVSALQQESAFKEPGTSDSRE